MKKVCAISGYPLTVSPYFSNYFTRSLHPLLEVRTNRLLELIGTKSWFEWQEDEAKLLFLALANSLELLEVTPPAIANPSTQVIASSIELLVAIAGWHSVRAFPLPKLHITVSERGNEDGSTEKMLTFPELLNSIVASRAETAEADKLALEAIRLEDTIKILYAKCSIGANKHKVLQAKVADWAIKITTPAARTERILPEMLTSWHLMLTTPPIDAWKFQNQDITDLDEFMVCNLPHGCTASYEVMKHLTAMKQATTGLVEFLGVDSVIQVMDNDITEAPVEANFTTKLEYLIAKAKWQQRAPAKATTPATVAISYQEVPMEELDTNINDDSNEGEDNDEF